MEELKDLYADNGDSEHDMCGNSVNNEHTVNQDVFDELDSDNFIDNLNDWD